MSEEAAGAAAPAGSADMPAPAEKAAEAERQQADRQRDADRQKGTDEPDAEPAERPEAKELGKAAVGSVLGEGSTGSGAATSREVRTGKKSLAVHGGVSHVWDGNAFYGQVGDSYHYQVQMRSTPPPLAGPVPPEQLAAGVEVYSEVPDYAQIDAGLRQTRLVILCGEPGSGRLST